MSQYLRVRNKFHLRERFSKTVISRAKRRKGNSRRENDLSSTLQFARFNFFSRFILYLFPSRTVNLKKEYIGLRSSRCNERNDRWNPFHGDLLRTIANQCIQVENRKIFFYPEVRILSNMAKFGVNYAIVFSRCDCRLPREIVRLVNRLHELPRYRGYIHS